MLGRHDIIILLKSRIVHVRSKDENLGKKCKFRQATNVVHVFLALVVNGQHSVHRKHFSTKQEHGSRNKYVESLYTL